MPSTPSDNTQADALKQVLDFVQTTENLNEDKHELFVRLDRLYAFKDNQVDIEPWLSNLQITGAFEFVERPFSAMVANTPSFELTSSNQNAPMLELEPQVLDRKDVGGDGFTEVKKALKIPFKEVYESDLGMMWRVRRMKDVLRRITKGMLIFGTYGAEIRQEILEEEDFADLVDEEGIDNLQSIVKKVTPVVEPFDIFDVIVSPFARNIDEAVERFGGFGAVRNYVTIRDLDEDVYFNQDKLDEAINGTAEGNIPKLDEKQQKQQRVSENSNGQGGPGTFELLEVWTYFTAEDEQKVSQQKKMIIGIANRDTVVRFEEVDEDDDIPFCIARDQEVPGQFFGIGEIEPIISDLYEENTIKNQRVDYNNRLLNEEWLLRSDAGVDPSQLVSKPHNIIIGDDIGDTALRTVQRTTAPLAVSGEDIDRIRRDMVSTTGSIAVEAAGGEGGLTNTATGEIIREKTAVARYAAKTENLEFCVADIARKMLRLKAKNIQDGEMIPVFIRGRWREVRGELYKKYIDNYEVGVKAGSMNVQSAITDRNNAIAVLNISKGAAADGLQPDMEEAYRTLFSSFPNVDVDKILPRKLPDLQNPVAAPQEQTQPLPEEISQLPGLKPAQAPAGPQPSLDQV